MVPETLLKSLGRSYLRCIEKGYTAYDRIKGKKPGNRNAWVGKYAEALWLSTVLPNHTGIRSKSIRVDPLSSVSNLGDPRRTDAAATLLSGERAQFELKKSDYGGRRVEYQLAAQIFDLGSGTYGAESLNVIYGENGRIDIYTREQGRKVVGEALKEGGSVASPGPSKTIEFAPDRTAERSARIAPPDGKSAAAGRSS